MNEIIVKDELKIEDMIYEIRGKQVMLDSDLAKLYDCANGTKTINQAVKRHINRFPKRFRLQLTGDEISKLRSQTGTAIYSDMTRTLPYAFTEQGVAMLATVLRTKVAEEISIRIMDAFVLMRHYISQNILEQNYINKLVLEDHERVNILEESFDKLKEKTKLNSLFFEGQVYDAYSLLLDILNESKKEIIIIDNYAGKELLDILKELDRNITIFSKNINEELKKKYTSQYTNVNFTNNTSFHDRFIIIDKSVLYHCGSSFKDLGKKCFGINRIDDKKIVNSILENLKE